MTKLTCHPLPVDLAQKPQKFNSHGGDFFSRLLNVMQISRMEES